MAVVAGVVVYFWVWVAVSLLICGLDGAFRGRR